MKLDDAIDQALRSPEPVRKLREVALDRFARGADREAVLALFEDARRQLRQAGRDADEDAILEIMDFLVGWCSPHVKLKPEAGREPRTNGLSSPADHGTERTTGLPEEERADGEE